MGMCKRCRAFYDKYPLQETEMGKAHILDEGYSSDPLRCAFPDGVFSTDNWGCETMLHLRRWCSNREDDEPVYPLAEYHYRDDDRCACIGVLQIPEEDEENGIQQGYVVMSWYKRRGRTGQVWVFWDEEEPKHLTLATAEFIIAKCGKT